MRFHLSDCLTASEVSYSIQMHIYKIKHTCDKFKYMGPDSFICPIIGETFKFVYVSLNQFRYIRVYKKK